MTGPRMNRDGARKTVYLLLYACVIACALWVRAGVAWKHSFPEGDEGPWLRMAARAFTADFLVSKVIEHDLYPKRVLPHPEDNRSPLFPLMIKAGTIFTKDYFTAGQLINIILFTLMFIIFAIYIRSRFGDRIALISMIFIGVSPICIVNTSHIYNDVTVAFSFFFFLFCAETIPRSRRNALIAGVFLGLLFLLKTSAVFLLFPITASFFIHGINKKTGLNVLLFLASFLLLASPWLIRNIVVFGSPMYQFTGLTIFSDSVYEIFGVGNPKPGFSSYLQRHDIIFTIVLRPVIGFKNLLVQIFTHDHHLSLVLLPLAVAGAWSLRRLGRFWLYVFLFSVPYAGLMSYVAYGFWVDRYCIVYYLLIYFCAAAGIEFISGLIKPPIVRFTTVAVLAALPMITVMRPLEFYVSPRGNEKELDRDARAIVAEVRKTVPDTESVLSSLLSGYCFMHDVRTVNTLHFKTPEELGMLIETYRIRYALLDVQKDNSILNLLNAQAGHSGLLKLTATGPFCLYRIAGPEPAKIGN